MIVYSFPHYKIIQSKCIRNVSGMVSFLDGIKIQDVLLYLKIKRAIPNFSEVHVGVSLEYVCGII